MNEPDPIEDDSNSAPFGRDSSKEPLATFAVLTDVQYADVDDAFNYDKTKMRYYRNSLKLVREAVTNWQAYSSKHGRQIKFLLQLGDLIDGKSKKINDSQRSLELLLGELSNLFEGGKATGPDRILHIWGNHEFYNFKRRDLLDSPLNTARNLGQNVDSGANYFTYEITPKLRLICLDFYEFSVLGFDETDPVYQKAQDLLRSHNKNEDLNSVEGMRGHALRFSAFNGSPSDRQMKWLEKELKATREAGARAIVCGHVPIHAQAADVRCIAWNSKEILELLWAFEGTVVLYLAGHDHFGGYFRDKKNIHHLTLHAIIETPPNSNAYATINVYDDRISIEGVGAVGYYEISFGGH